MDVSEVYHDVRRRLEGREVSEDVSEAYHGVRREWCDLRERGSQGL